MSSQSVIHVISKPPAERTRGDVDVVVPWLKKKSEVLQGLENVVLEEIVRGCDYQQSKPDKVIIQQGDIGDCLYIILAGSVSVYIDGGRGAEEDSLFTDDASSPEPKTATHQKKAKVTMDRSPFGKFIIKFDAGKSFGEIALMTEDSVRNASIITDEPTYLLVIHRDLFNHTLKAHQEREFRDRKSFARSTPYFSRWSRHSQRLLEMSLIREVYAYDQPIVRQGEPWRGLIFIRKGRARVTTEPSRHASQYPQMCPFLDADEALQAQLTRSKEHTDLKPRSHDVRQDQVAVRRKKGYSAAEQRMHLRTVDVCNVGEGETIGDVEVVMNMNTYMQTVVCMCETDVYIVTIKNFERLVPRRNPGTMDTLRRICQTKLSSRINTIHGKRVPLFGHLLHNLTMQLRPESTRKMPRIGDASFKELPQKEELFNHMMSMFVKNKAQVCEPHVAGSVYYRDIMREKARIRESIRKHRNTISKTKRPVWYAMKRSKVHPRSIKAIRQALDRQKETTGDHHEVAVMQQLRALEQLQLQAEYQKNADDLRDKLYLMGPGFAKDSVRLPAIEDEVPEQPPQPKYTSEDSGGQTNEHNSLTKDVNNNNDSGGAGDSQLIERANTFITEIDNHDTKSNPEMTSPARGEFQDGQQESKPASIHVRFADEADDEESSSRPSTCPQSESLSEDEQTRYMNAIARRRMQETQETPAYRDWETSDKSLSYLEKRLQDFQPITGERVKPHGSLPKLRRFEVGDAVEQPRPGGRVMVRRRACPMSQNRYKVLDHEHTRYHMVPSMPDYENLKKTKMLLHMAVDDARSKWIKTKAS